MAQVANSEVVAEKKTREQRVTFKGDPADFVAVFKMPGGETVELEHRALPSATITHCLQYGMRRVFQDGLSGRIKDGESADDVAADLIDRFKSGDWAGRRGGGGGRGTIEAFAKTLATNALPKDATKEEIAAKVAEYRANPKAWAIVERRYAAQFESIEDELEDESED